MRFLLDENLSPQLARYLHKLGYQAQAVRDVGLKGKPDEAIIHWLQKQQASLVTADLDFGEFFYWRSFGSFGVVIVRPRVSGRQAHERLLSRLHREGVLHDERLRNSLLVVDERAYRWRRFIRPQS